LQKRSNQNGPQVSEKFRNGCGSVGLFARSRAGRGPKPPPISPSELETLIKPGPGVTAPERGGGRLKTVQGERFVSGFNFEIGDASVWFTPDHITFFIFCFNPDGSFFFDRINSSLLTSAQAELKNACDHPGGDFVFVTSPSTGAFDEIVVPEP
jgi:hypothetical protein